MKIKVTFPAGTPVRHKEIFYGRFKGFGYEFEESPDAEYLVATTFIYLNQKSLADFYAKAPYYVTILDLFAEAFVPDFNWFDYAIGMDRFEFSDRMIRLPLRIEEFVDLNDCRIGMNPEQELQSKAHFCNFIYKNAKAHPSRDAFFHALCRYKLVHSLGEHLNNYKGDGLFCGDGNGESWLSSSIRMKRDYKFTISFENAFYPGYVSEKLLTTFMANSVPIYWGNPDIDEEYNPEAFVNCHRFANIEEVVDYVRYLDNTPEAYMAMLQAPPRTPEQDVRFRAQLAKAQERLRNIFATPKDASVIKSDGFWLGNYRRITSCATLATHPSPIPVEKLPRKQTPFITNHHTDKKMKYAKLFYLYNYTFRKRFGDGGWDGSCNLGDNVQTMAVMNLFRNLPKPPSEEELVWINRDDLTRYEGDEVILPMQGWFGKSAGEMEWPPAPQVNPVFVGFHLAVCNNGLKQFEDLNGFKYLQEHQPIGCRDLATRDYLRENGVDAYFSGCNTLTFPRREKEPENGKIYIVDVIPHWMKFIPKSIKDEAEVISQIAFCEEYPMREEEARGMEAEARELINMYRDTAKLVITSRIHCAMPCLAMGIPVIFLCWSPGDVRFSVLQHFIHTYSLKETALVNWSPEPVEYENLKKAMITNAVARMEAKRLGIPLTQEESQQLIDNVQIEFAKVKERYIKPVVEQSAKSAPAAKPAPVAKPAPAEKSVSAPKAAPKGKGLASNAKTLLQITTSDEKMNKLLMKAQYKALRRVYNRCKLASMVTVGKRREHYVAKMKRLKEMLRALKR